jgi:acetyl esterase
MYTHTPSASVEPEHAVDSRGASFLFRRALRVGLLVVSALILLPSAFLIVGAFNPQIPYVGGLGSLIWPTLIGPALVLVLAGTLLALGALLLGSRRIAAIVAGLGVMALVGTSVIFGEQVRTAAAAGVSVTPTVFSAPDIQPPRPDESVTYLTDETGASLALDIYQPNADVEQSAAGAPIIVYIHGGGWIGGSPDEVSADLRWFADQGYWVISPEYTLATEDRPTWDTAMPQIGCALVWAAKNAAAYGADASRIAAWGSSAGGNLAVTTTYAAASGQLKPACEGELPAVRAVAGEVPAVDPAYIYDNADPLFGAATRNMVSTYIGGRAEDYPERIRAIQAATYLSAEAPPTLLSVSEGDHLVPVQSVRSFVARASEAGVEIHALYRRWADHAISSVYDYLPNQTLIQMLLDHFRTNGV